MAKAHGEGGGSQASLLRSWEELMAPGKESVFFKGVVTSRAPRPRVCALCGSVR